MTINQIKEKYLNKEIKSDFVEEFANDLNILQDKIKYNELTEEYHVDVSNDVYYIIKTKTEKAEHFLKTTVISIEEKHLVPPLGLAKM